MGAERLYLTAATLHAKANPAEYRPRQEHLIPVDSRTLIDQWRRIATEQYTAADVIRQKVDTILTTYSGQEPAAVGVTARPDESIEFRLYPDAAMAAASRKPPGKKRHQHAWVFFSVRVLPGGEAELRMQSKNIYTPQQVEIARSVNLWIAELSHQERLQFAHGSLQVIAGLDKA